MDHLIGMKFGMGTLDDMNHLKNKRIRFIANLFKKVGSLPKLSLNCILFVYNLSKDLVLPGFRVGMNFFNNELVCKKCCTIQQKRLIAMKFFVAITFILVQ